jgi:hypothetical protein
VAKLFKTFEAVLFGRKREKKKKKARGTLYKWPNTGAEAPRKVYPYR